LIDRKTVGRTDGWTGGQIDVQGWIGRQAEIVKDQYWDRQIDRNGGQTDGQTSDKRIEKERQTQVGQYFR
jgi:hypothetical protein